MTDAVTADALEERSELSRLTNEVVHLYKEQLGRGPTKGRANWAGRDTLVVTLENTMLPAERNLIEAGEDRRVIESRLILMAATESRFVEAVEQITGRTVRAIVCGALATPDISTEVFYLEPESASAS